MERCLYIIRFSTRFTLLNGIQWYHKWGNWNL